MKPILFNADMVRAILGGGGAKDGDAAGGEAEI